MPFSPYPASRKLRKMPELPHAPGLPPAQELPHARKFLHEQEILPAQELLQGSGAAGTPDTLQASTRIPGPLSCTMLILLLALTLGSCTTSAWMVAEQPVADPDSETTLSEKRFFHPVITPSPQNPVFSLELLNERALLYNMHLASERYIQQYRPRYGYMALGLSGMAMGLYLSNSSVIDADRLSTRERAMLNVAAVSIGAASYLTMKPDGEPRPAGEVRLLQKTGTRVIQDSIPVPLSTDARARLTITRGTENLVDARPLDFRDNAVSFHIGQVTDIRRLPGSDTTGLHLQLEYQDVRFDQYTPLSAFMQEFVEVTTSSVPLRTSPAILSNNIIQHVGSQSRFPFLNDVDDRWYRILRSDGPAYVPKEYSRRIWQVADTARIGDQVVLPDHMVFGDIEIERNLPDNRRANPDAIAIFIINGEYRDPLQHLPNASRTAQLASLYASQVLGYYSDNIRVYENMTYHQMRRLLQQSDSLMIGGRHLSQDESDLFIYYYGHGITDPDNRFLLVPVDYDPAGGTSGLIPVQDLVDTIAGMSTRKSVMVLDTDWSRASVFGTHTDNGVRTGAEEAQALQSVMARLPETAAAFWAASPGQRSGTYSGNSDRVGYPYDIFTWYFFQGLKDGRRTTGDLESYLERNVPFTSRRLLDRAQDPGFAGNDNLILVRDRPDEP